MTYSCRYCNKSFSKESTLSVHLCEPKRRFQQRNERGVDLGFRSYLKFFEYTQGSAKLKTWEDFETSPYYRAFVKFGQYCVGTRVVNPARFTEWLIKNNKKIDHWCKDTLYTEYLLNYLQVETPADALARAIEYSIDWQERTGHPAQDCLRYGNHNATCFAITSGRLSAWVIYNSESGQKFLSEIDSTQIAMIWSYIDSDIWQKKFRDYLADQEYVKEMLVKAGW